MFRQCNMSSTVSSTVVCVDSERHLYLASGTTSEQKILTVAPARISRLNLISLCGGFEQHCCSCSGQASSPSNMTLLHLSPSLRMNRSRVR